MSQATSLKRSTTIEVSTQDRIRARSRTQNQETAKTDIQGNTFHKIITNTALSPEQKKSEIAQALQFTESKEENRTRMAEFENFKEYMHNMSEEMSKERISMTDTEVYASLQKVYGEFNDDLEKFISDIKPLTDITDSLHKLRKEGRTDDILAKVNSDRKWVEEKTIARNGIEYDISNLEGRIRTKNREIEKHQENRGMFGFGSVKAESLSAIELLKAEIAEAQAEIEVKKSEVSALSLEIQEHQSELDNDADAQQLRRLLDLSSGEHIQNMENTVQSALKFVTSGKERFGETRGHLTKMNNQIEGLGDNNQTLLQITAIMNEATKEAEEYNQKQRETYLNIPEDASLIQKMKFEENRQNIEEHIDTLSTSAVDTMQTYADLHTEAIKINTMKASIKKQSDSARAMHSRGIASVASQLNTVIFAVGGAAVNEGAMQAGNTLNKMTRVTNEIAQKEAIRIATGRDDINVELENTIQTLMDFSDSQREATAITRESVATMRENLAALKAMSEEVGEDTRNFTAVAADVVAEDQKQAKTESEKPVEKEVETSKSPFKL